MVLEQFQGMLNTDLQVWVREHTPRSSAEAADLMETFVTARPSRRKYSWAHHNMPGEDHTKPLRAKVLHLGHSIPWAGLLGKEKTEQDPEPILLAGVPEGYC